MENKVPEVLLPPFALRVGFRDKLRFTVIGWVAGRIVSFRGRLLLLDGSVVPFEQRITIVAVGTSYSIEMPVDSGYLISASANVVTTSVAHGEVFAQISLVRAETSTSGLEVALVANYVTSTTVRSWPHSPIVHPLETPGYKRIIGVTSPAAGDPGFYNLATYETLYVYGVSFRLVTDANAANRQPSIALMVGATEYFHAISSLTQAASLTNDWYFTSWGKEDFLALAHNHVNMPPVWYNGEEAHGLNILVENIQVGDQLSNIRIFSEQYFNL